MDTNKYDIKPWKKYKLPDNGVYGPKGSQPTFHVETIVFHSDYNPIHPFAQGYIMHNQMPGNHLVPQRRVFVSDIGEMVD